MGTLGDREILGASIYTAESNYNILDDLNNSTLQREFHMLAFTNFAEWKFVIFNIVLLIYLLSVLGNMIIVILVCHVSKLQTPMYFFLCNLSVQDLINVTSFQPKFLAITITGDTAITFPHCITQIFIFIMCIDSEFFLLTTMAYDRYVAVCVPLRYSLIMSKRICLYSASGCWITGSLNAIRYSFIISFLSFCKSKEINHFFCEVECILKLSCNNTRNIERLIFVESFLFGLFPFILVLISYVCIISTIVKIRTKAGRLKAFSSCSSHLTVVILLYGTGLSSYMKSGSESSQEQDKLITMFYIMLVPVLNPLVYSLRNKEVLKAFRILMQKKTQMEL
ncbi:olfactory receptor 5AR1-like [Pelobates fuscus]|uniref:olfactory receptor 5AR1-like n=1 Tax=Pelobates fuscus TaxID=191477 RepID=UPI002FE49864